MKRIWLGIAAVATLSACSGGNPFADDGDDIDVDTPTLTIPAELANDLEGVTYNAAAQTLTVRGISLDNTPIQAVYRRRPGLDRGGYQAYTTQDSSLQRHSTAYVKELDGVRAAVVATGGQFGYYFAGSAYGRTGAFDRPDVSAPNMLVSYAGNYVGVRNVSGSGEDLLPVAPGTPPSILPNQLAEVTGAIFINADFADNVVNGVVYDRISVDSGEALNDLDLAPTAIETDGTFVGDVEQNGNGRGTYGGIFGGTDASAVAGTLFAREHNPGTDQEEYGVFVLAQCGTPTADPVCNQPVP